MGASSVDSGQVVHGRFVRGVELQIGVLNVPHQQALAFQESADPLADRLDERFQCPGTGRRQAVKHGWLMVDEIHPVQKQHVKVNVEIQGTAEALYQRHGAGLRVGAGAARLLDQMAVDGPVDDAQHPAHDLRPAGEQESELEGKAQDPLAHGQPGQDLVDQQRGAFHHPAGAATRAETTPFVT